MYNQHKQVLFIDSSKDFGRHASASGEVFATKTGGSALQQQRMTQRKAVQGKPCTNRVQRNKKSPWRCRTKIARAVSIRPRDW